MGKERKERACGLFKDIVQTVADARLDQTATLFALEYAYGMTLAAMMVDEGVEKYLDKVGIPSIRKAAKSSSKIVQEMVEKYGAKGEGFKAFSQAGSC